MFYSRVSMTEDDRIMWPRHEGTPNSYNMWCWSYFLLLLLVLLLLSLFFLLLLCTAARINMHYILQAVSVVLLWTIFFFHIFLLNHIFIYLIKHVYELCVELQSVGSLAFANHLFVDKTKYLNITITFTISYHLYIILELDSECHGIIAIN